MAVQTPKQRSRALIGLMCLLGAVFVVRLFYVQIIQHGHYAALASEEHARKFTIQPKRGLIYAHDGQGKYAKLVLNEPVYTVYADPRYVKDPSKAEATLRKIAGGNVLSSFELSLRDTTKQYVVIAKNLNKEQADLLKKEKLAGVGLQEYERRVYPEEQLAAQVLGFVNAEGKGNYGIEQGLDEELTGKPGLLKAVTDVHGIPLSVGPESVQVAPQQGQNLVLTLDRNVQHKAEEALRAGLERAKATKGSVLIMNPNNGHVLAMASYPTYNPNEYSKVEKYETFQNPVISSPFEPGSVIKPLTMGVGLNEGVIEPQSTYANTSGGTMVRDRLITNILKSPTGQVNMVQVLQYSFNTGVVHVLRQLGGGEINMQARQKLYQYFTDRYFFDRPTGIELAGEAYGDIIDPTAADGGDVRYANMSFGQGMTATMLQTAAAFSAGLNGGVYYTPRIVDGYLKEDGSFAAKAPEIRKSDIISSASSAKLKQMLHEARVGSSISAGDKTGYMQGGKTGTAQVYDPKTGTYSESETIGSYLGFGGQEKPAYVIMIRVDDARIGGYSGSAAAAPIFTEISNWMLDYLQIKPKG